jgi:drug/metabolite transporter (DMT)-like permease
MSKKVQAWLLLAALTLIWGSSFVLIKKGLVSFDAAELGSLRLSVAFLAFTPFVFKAWRSIPLSRFKILLLTALSGNFFPAFLFAKAQTQLNSGLTGVLNALTPVFTLLLGLIVFSQPVKKLQVLGLLTAFSGAAGLALIGKSGSLGELNFYVFYVIAATLMYGLSANLIKHKLSDLPALELSAASLSLVGTVSAVILIFTTDFVPKVMSGNHYPALFYVSVLGIFGTAVGLYLFNKLIQLTDAVFGSLVTYLMPVVALSWGFVLGEELSLWHFGGMILIFTGVVLVNYSNLSRLGRK